MCAARRGRRSGLAWIGKVWPLLVATAGFTVVVSGLLAATDLGGWPPSMAGVAEPTLNAAPEGSRDVRLTDCVRGTVDPYASPRGEEAAGTATLSVIACRSKSWVLVASVLYWAAAVGALSILLLRASARLRRHRS